MMVRNNKSGHLARKMDIHTAAISNRLST